MKLFSFKKSAAVAIFYVFVILFLISAVTTQVMKGSDIPNIITIFTYAALLLLIILYLIDLNKGKILIKLISAIRSIKNKERTILLIYVLIAVLCLWRALITPGTIGMHDDWAIPPFNEQLVRFGFDSYYAWQTQMLGFPSSYLSDFLLKHIIGLFALIGANGEITKYLLLALLALSGCSGYKLAKTVKIKQEGAFLSGLFYMLTPVIFNRVVPGYTNYILAYSLTPLIFSFFIKSVEDKKLKLRNIIATGLLFALSGVQMQYFIMLPLLFLLYSLFSESINEFIKRFSVIFIAGAMALLIHAPWILPSLMNSGAAKDVMSNKAITWVTFLHPSLIKAMLLQGASYGFFRQSLYINNIALLLWAASAIILVFIVFSNIILNKNNRTVSFFLVLALITLFIAKGINPPLGGIYRILYANIPLMSLFRDLHNILVLPALAYTCLIGFATPKITETTKGVINLDATDEDLTAYLIFALLVVLILIYAWPFFTGNFANNLNINVYKPEYYELFKKMEQDTEDYRVLYTPAIQPIRYAENSYPGVVDPILYYSPKSSLPSLIQYSNSDRLSTFVDISLHQNRTNQLGRILGLANVKFIIQRSDFYSSLPNFLYPGRYIGFDKSYIDDNVKYNLNLQEGMSKTEQIGLVKTNVTNQSLITIYNNSYYREHFTDARSTALVGGSWPTIITGMHAGELNNSFMFASQISDTNQLNHIDNILFENPNYIDTVEMFIPKIFKINLGNYAGETDAKKGWASTNGWWWYNWELSGLLSNGVITQNTARLDVPLNLDKSSEYTLLAKIYFNYFGTPLYFLIDDIRVGVVNSAESNSKFAWVNIGKVSLQKGTHKLAILSEFGENIISDLIVAPTEDFEKALNKTAIFMQDKDIAVIQEFESINEQIFLMQNYNEWLIKNTTDYSDVYTNYNREMDVYLNKQGNDSIISTNPLNPDVDVYQNLDVNLNDYNFLILKVRAEDYNTTLSFDTLADNKIDAELNFGNITGVLDIHQLIKDYLPNREKYILKRIEIIANSTKNPNFGIKGIDMFRYKFQSPDELEDLASQGEVMRLCTNLTVKLFVPATGDYTLGVLGSNDTVNININGTVQELNLGNNDTELNLVNSNILQLEKGEYNLTFQSDNALLDLFVLKRAHVNKTVGIQPQINFTKINPVSYLVSVNSSEPFTLVFSESFDNNWIAASEGQNFEHFEINGFANAFYINKTGNLKINVEYRLQKYTELGYLIMIITLIICLLIYWAANSKYS